MDKNLNNIEQKLIELVESIQEDYNFDIPDYGIFDISDSKFYSNGLEEIFDLRNEDIYDLLDNKVVMFVSDLESSDNPCDYYVYIVVPYTNYASKIPLVIYSHDLDEIMDEEDFSFFKLDDLKKKVAEIVNADVECFTNITPLTKGNFQVFEDISYSYALLGFGVK